MAPKPHQTFSTRTEYILFKEVWGQPYEAGNQMKRRDATTALLIHDQPVLFGFACRNGGHICVGSVCCSQGVWDGMEKVWRDRRYGGRGWAWAHRWSWVWPRGKMNYKQPVLQAMVNLSSVHQHAACHMLGTTKTQYLKKGRQHTQHPQEQATPDGISCQHANCSASSPPRSSFSVLC